MSAPCPRCGSMACAEDRAAYEAFGDPPDIFDGGALELTPEHAADLLQPDLDPVADPDADRPCGCEEAERLRETIARMRREWFSPEYGVHAAERLRKAEARVVELEEQLLETKEALERRGG